MYLEEKTRQLKEGRNNHQASAEDQKVEQLNTKADAISRGVDLAHFIPERGHR
jgi:hypothetical protein